MQVEYDVRQWHKDWQRKLGDPVIKLLQQSTNEFVRELFGNGTGLYFVDVPLL